MLLLVSTPVPPVMLPPSSETALTPTLCVPMAKLPPSTMSDEPAASAASTPVTSVPLATRVLPS